MGAKRKRYIPAYRRDAAHLVIDTGRPISAVAVEIGVGSQLLGRWVRSSGPGWRTRRRRSMRTNVLSCSGSAGRRVPDGGPARRVAVGLLRLETTRGRGARSAGDPPGGADREDPRVPSGLRRGQTEHRGYRQISVTAVTGSPGRRSRRSCGTRASPVSAWRRGTPSPPSATDRRTRSRTSWAVVSTAAPSTSFGGRTSPICPPRGAGCTCARSATGVRDGCGYGPWRTICVPPRRDGAASRGQPGTPRTRTPPSRFGISTDLTGGGK